MAAFAPTRAIPISRRSISRRCRRILAETYPGDRPGFPRSLWLPRDHDLRRGRDFDSGADRFFSRAAPTLVLGCYLAHRPILCVWRSKFLVACARWSHARLAVAARAIPNFDRRHPVFDHPGGVRLAGYIRPGVEAEKREAPITRLVRG